MSPAPARPPPQPQPPVPRASITDLGRLLRELQPRRQPGVHVCATLPPGHAGDPTRWVATVREAEGLSVILPEADAQALGVATGLRLAWITLDVPSDLQAVGLTAAVAGALARAGIACNGVAGACHDHLFMPLADADAAMAALQALQRQAMLDNPALP